jgi:hypothetical protein
MQSTGALASFYKDCSLFLEKSLLVKIFYLFACIFFEFSVLACDWLSSCCQAR